MARKVISLASGFVFLAGDDFLVFLFLFVVCRFDAVFFFVFADLFFAAIVIPYPPNAICCGILYYENPSNASSFANKCLCLLFLFSRLHQALQFGKGAADPAYLLDQSLHYRILSYQDSPQIF